MNDNDPRVLVDMNGRAERKALHVSQLESPARIYAERAAACARDEVESI